MIYTINEMYSKARELCSARYPDELAIGDLLTHLPKADTVEAQRAGLEMIWGMVRAYLCPTRFREVCNLVWHRVWAWHRAMSAAIWRSHGVGFDPKCSSPVRSFAGLDLRGCTFGGPWMLLNPSVADRWGDPEFMCIHPINSMYLADLRGADLSYCFARIASSPGVIFDDTTVLPLCSEKGDQLIATCIRNGWFYVPSEPRPIHRPDLDTPNG